MFDTMKKSTPIPAEAFKNHIGILGKTGSGKTNTAKGFAEALMQDGKRVCALDPTGAWWGLRLQADGKQSAFPVVIFGGRHADIPLTEGSGSRLANIIATGNFSAVIDTSLQTVGERTRFFTEFAEALFRDNSKPLHLIIDEAHVFAPQGRVPDPQSGRMLHAANNLVSGGRSRGLRIMLISQRPAKLHKDSLTQVEMLISMRLIAPQDRAAVEAWVGEWADPKKGRELISSLPSLPRGDGWVWAPELGLLQLMHFPKINTFDSSSTPEDGEEIEVPETLEGINISAIQDLLSYDEVEPKNKSAQKINSQALVEAEEKGYIQGYKEGINEGLAKVMRYIECARQNGESETKNTEIKASIVEFSPAKVSADINILLQNTSAAATANKNGAELRVLRVLAARHPARFTKAQWATLSGMKRTGGTWQTYVSRLRTAGYLDESGNNIGLTKSGLEAAGHVEKPAAGSIIEQWKFSLGTGCSKMIDALVKIYPRSMDRANLADLCGMTATGGTFQTYLSRLKSNGLIDVTGKKVVACQVLFMDEGKAAC